MDRGAEETDMRDLRLQTQPTCGTTGMVSRCGIPPSCGKGGMWENGARFIGGDAGFPKEMRMPPIAVPLLPADGQWKGNGAIFPSSRTERPSRKEIGEIGENRLFPPVPVSKEHPAETIRLRSRKRGKEMTSTGHTVKVPRQKNNRKIEAEMGRANRGGDPIAFAPGKRSSVFLFPTFIFRGSCGESSVQQAVMRKRFGSDFPESLPEAISSLHLQGLRPLPERRDKGTITGPEILFDVRPDAGKTLNNGNFLIPFSFSRPVLSILFHHKYVEYQAFGNFAFFQHGKRRKNPI